MIYYLGFVLFLLSGAFYYFTPLPEVQNIGLFSVISGIFFALYTSLLLLRLINKHSDIRIAIADFDGEMSAMYREFGHLGTKEQTEAKKIITKYYKNIVENKAWDYNFTHKTTTITDLHKLIGTYSKKKKLEGFASHVVQRILSGLEVLQNERKKMVILNSDHVTQLHWIVIHILFIIFLICFSMVLSQSLILLTGVKAILFVGIFYILMLLKGLDKLRYFESTIGESSAQDVLDIFAGKK